MGPQGCCAGSCSCFLTFFQAFATVLILITHNQTTSNIFEHSSVCPARTNSGSAKRMPGFRSAPCFAKSHRQTCTIYWTTWHAGRLWHAEISWYLWNIRSWLQLHKYYILVYTMYIYMHYYTISYYMIMFTCPRHCKVQNTSQTGPNIRAPAILGNETEAARVKETDHQVSGFR